MHKVLLVSFLVVSAFALSACASDSGATVASNDPNRTICRTEPDTGSRIPKRTCKTAAEWERIAEENRQAKRDLRRSTVERDAAVESGRVN